MSPVLMEVLQMLKFALKKEHLNFTSAWMIDQKDLYTDGPDGNLLAWMKRCEDNPNNLNDLQDEIMQYMDQYKVEE
jgi:hypothetical protein